MTYLSTTLRPRNVVARAPVHRADLADQVVERLVVAFQIDLRGLDDEERRRRVVEEEVLIGLVELPQIGLGGIGGRTLGVRRPAAETLDEDVGRRLQVD